MFQRQGKGGGGKQKGGDDDTAVKAFKGLIMLCVEKAEEALSVGDKRSFDDIFAGPFKDVCIDVLAELEKLEVGCSPFLHSIINSTTTFFIVINSTCIVTQYCIYI